VEVVDVEVVVVDVEVVRDVEVVLDVDEDVVVDVEGMLVVVVGRGASVSSLDRPLSVPSARYAVTAKT
jgi:hypothetical protein